MATYLLIPGGGTAGSAWDDVAALLRAAGHDAVGVDLPSEDPAAGLPEYAAAAVAALGDRRDELVVVGQSLGAFTAAQVTARLPVARLVYVCPMIPLPGETPGEWWEATGHAEAFAPVAEEFGPMGDWDVDALNAVFLNDADPAAIAAAERHLRDDQGGVFATPLALDAPPAVPTHVIAGEVDRFFPPAFVARLARERLGVEATVIPTGHAPMLSRPGVLADALLAL